MRLFRFLSPALLRFQLMPAPLFYERIKVQLSRLLLSRRPREKSTRDTRRLFVDISVISKNDAGTGIQRVVRGIALHRDDLEAAGWDVQYVAATRKRPYHSVDWPTPSDNSNRTPIQARTGDVFLGLDYSLDTVRFHKGQLRRFSRNGGRLWFLVHDILPLQRPEWFSDASVVRYRKWFRIIASVADGFFCNSKQTEAELIAALDQRYDLHKGFRTRVLPMATDIRSSLHTLRLKTDLDEKITRLCSRPFILVVGTLEPRKGHSDVLKAFEHLWQDGLATSLVFVGRPGWKVDQLTKTISSHPQARNRLLWFSDASDEDLIRLYKSCDGVIVASYAEGFGLPVIEALHYGKPVLARELPVFEPHRDRGVWYFPADSDIATLTGIVRKWLLGIEDGSVVVKSASPIHWSASVAILLETLETEAD